ncbi:MAG: PAS domain S-box protein [Candidatus Binataceae bacterium]|jgi:PAS domain S-box-containing protein
MQKRPESSWSELTWLGFAVALTAAIAVAVMVYDNALQMNAARAWMTNSLIILRTLDQARAETSEAFYRLNEYTRKGDLDDLHQAADSAAQLVDLGASLASLIDDPAQQNLLGRFDLTAEQLPALLQDSVRNAAALPHDRPVLAQNDAKLSGGLYQLRQDLTNIAKIQEQLITAHRTMGYRIWLRTLHSIEFGGGFVFLTLTTLSGFIYLSTVHLKRSQSELASSQAELAAAALREWADKIFHGLLEGAPDAMIVVDNAGRIALVNAQAEMLFRYYRGEMIGQGLEMLLPQRFRERHAGHLAAYFKAPQIRPMGSTLELFGRHKDGTEFPAEISLSKVEIDQRILFTASIRDITERKAAELRRQQAEENFRLLVQNVRDYAIFMLDPDGRVVTWNQGAQRIEGYRAEEIIGQDSACFYLPEDIAAGKPAHALEMARQKGSYESEGLRVRQDGSQFWADVVISALHGPKGDIRGFSMIVRDITQRREAAAQVRAAERAAATAGMVRSEFLGRVSHELRTPLNAIIGTAELQLMADLSSEQRTEFELIQSSGELLLNIVDDLLDLSQAAAGKLTLEKLDFDLIHLVEGVVDAFATLSRRKDIEVSMYLDLGIPAGLRGDPTKLRQILNNLLSNAIKFTPAGGVLLRVLIDVETDKDVQLRFEVIDTGIGIPPEVQGRLFQPFVQADESTHRRFGGTGLGLAISKQLTDLMGGQIGLRSETGRGSTFAFTLPFEKSPQILPNCRTAAIVPQGSIVQALIVDDNAMNQRLISDYLTRWGVTSKVVSSAALALQELRYSHERRQPYALILADETIRGASGTALAHAIKQDPAFRDTKVIVMAPTGVIDSSNADVDHWIAKPIHSSNLFEVIFQLCAGASAKSEMSNAAGSQASVAEHAYEASRPTSILVVDDSPAMQDVVTKQLAKLGCKSYSVADAEAGLDALARQAYDIVLLDCELPGMDGYEMAREIRQREGEGHHVTIIAFTANASKGAREKCLEAGMDDYLSKPLKLQALAASIYAWTSVTAEYPLSRPPRHDAFSNGALALRK